MFIIVIELKRQGKLCLLPYKAKTGESGEDSAHVWIEPSDGINSERSVDYVRVPL